MTGPVKSPRVVASASQNDGFGSDGTSLRLARIRRPEDKRTSKAAKGDGTLKCEEHLRRERPQQRDGIGDYSEVEEP